MKDISYNDDLEFLRERADKKTELPENLSRDSIEKLIENKKHKSSRKRKITGFVSAAAAVIIAVCTAVIADSFIFKPVELENSTAFNSLSYEEIEKTVRDYRKKTNAQQIAGGIFNGGIKDDGAAGDAVHSETNIRTENVSESDIFMTDGEYLYLLTDNSIEIVKTLPGGDMTKTGEIKISEPGDSDGFRPQSFMFYKNYIITAVNKSFYDEKSDRFIEQSGAFIHDISDRSNPVFIKELTADGRFADMKLISDKLIITVNQSIISDDRLLPGIYNGGKRELIPERNIYFTNPEKPEGYITVLSCDMKDMKNEVQSISVLGSGAKTYCTENNLYIMCGIYGKSTGMTADMIMPASAEKTQLIKIDITGTPEFRALKELTGGILNDYTIDEYKDFLRIALTTAGGADIVILDSELKTVAELKNIAENEQVKSARFIKDTAYVVTFRETDPLFVIDLTDPLNPLIKGELKIPGFSEYLHPVGKNLIAGIGFGGNDVSLDGSAKISLFDVSDPENPVETDAIILKDMSLQTDPHAYTQVKENSFLIPFIGYTDDGSDYVITGSLFVEAEGKKLELKSTCRIKSVYDTQRCAFIEGTVYNFIPLSGVISHDMDSGEFLSSYISGNNEEYGREKEPFIPFS